MMNESMQKNPAAMAAHLNRMDPKMLAQMGGRDEVMRMMQAEGGGMPGMGGGGMPNMNSMMQQLGMEGGGMPNMVSAAKMMQQMGMGGGAGGGMPDMATMANMMQGMGGR